MTTQRPIFKLYTVEKPGLIKLDITLCYDFFEELRIIADSFWYNANPRNQPLKYCMKYDVMNFLIELFDLNSEDAYRMVSDNSDPFRENNISKRGQSLFISKVDIAIIKNELQEHKVSFITDYFLDEYCFLIAYYSWLIPKEMQHDYTTFMRGFFPIQPEEEGIEDFLLKREETFIKINKLLGDAKTPLALKKHIEKWEYWKEVKKRMNIYYAIKNELKTTNKEEPNIMLIKKRAYNSFYCYLKYTVCPTSETYYKKRGLVSKYALKHNIPKVMSLHKDIEKRHLVTDLETAIDQILEKKLYIDSENKLLQIAGGIFELLGLSEPGLGFEYVKKFQEQESKKRYKRGPIYAMMPDGTKKLLWTKEENDKHIAEVNSQFSIKSSVESLKMHSIRQKSNSS
jgi:hypothetical protein